MKKSAVVVFWSYFIGIFIISHLNNFSFSWLIIGEFLVSFVSWLAGAGLGIVFMKLDGLIYVYFLKPAEPISLDIKNLFKQKQYQLALKELISREKEMKELTLKSALFQIAWIAIALFTISSTASYLGKGLVMAIGFQLLFSQWQAVLANQPLDWVFWQIKTKVGLKEQKIFLYLMTTVFLIFTLTLL